MAADQPAPKAVRMSVKIAILCAQPEMGETLAHCLGSPNPPGGAVMIGDVSVQLEVLAGDPRNQPAWVEKVRSAHIVILVVRFLDIISLDKLRTIHRHIPSDQITSLATVLFREEGETDFKMSCPACGQKLWVSDADAGKPGRCPNCRKGFVLPSQAQHVQNALMLSTSAQIITVFRDNANACRAALEDILTRMKTRTLRIAALFNQPPAAAP